MLIALWKRLKGSSDFRQQLCRVALINVWWDTYAYDFLKLCMYASPLTHIDVIILSDEKSSSKSDPQIDALDGLKVKNFAKVSLQFKLVPASATHSWVPAIFTKKDPSHSKQEF